MPFEALIKRVWRCTLRPWSSEFEDALWGRDQASWEMHVETEIGWTQRCSGRLGWSEFALGGRDRVNWEIHSELWLSKFRDALAAGYDWVILEEYLEVVDLEAVDGRRARWWGCIDWLVNLKRWECEEVTLPLKLSWPTSWWQWICREACQKLTLHSGVNSQLREWRDDRQSQVYAVLGVCCTRRMVHSALTHDDGMER